MAAGSRLSADATTSENAMLGIARALIVPNEQLAIDLSVMLQQIVDQEAVRLGVEFHEFPLDGEMPHAMFFRWDRERDVLVLPGILCVDPKNYEPMASLIRAVQSASIVLKGKAFTIRQLTQHKFGKRLDDTSGIEGTKFIDEQREEYFPPARKLKTPASPTEDQDGSSGAAPTSQPSPSPESMVDSQPLTPLSATPPAAPPPAAPAPMTWVEWIGKQFSRVGEGIARLLRSLWNWL